MSLSASHQVGNAFARCLFVALFIFFAHTTGRSQTAPATPHIDSVAVFQQGLSNATTQSQQTQSSNFILEINGTGFDSVDMANLRILVSPSTGVGAVTPLSRSTDNTKIIAQFSAPANYILQEVALSLTGTSFVTFSTGTESCDFDSRVVVQPQIVSQSQSKTKYGNGVAANFHVVQISLVNKCSLPIIVPLAGISVAPTGQNKSDACVGDGGGYLVPFSLDHVTSIYSANRKLTGARAIYFNSLQALATLGSAVEPFFGHGFTQGVAILGGGFTTASKEISVDMSTEQLQNITSQSFGATEQVSAGGSLQKFIFIRQGRGKCRDDIQEKDIRSGNFSVRLQMIAASAQTPATTTAKASPSAPAAQ